MKPAWRSAAITPPVRAPVAYKRVGGQSWLFPEWRSREFAGLPFHRREARLSLVRHAILLEREMFRRGFIALTAPRFLTFVVSLILALAALASLTRGCRWSARS
jgi:hypothetical protein